MGSNGNRLVVKFDCGSQQFADCAAAIIKVSTAVQRPQEVLLVSFDVGMHLCENGMVGCGAATMYREGLYRTQE